MADADRNTPAHFGFAYANEAVIALLSERGAGLYTLNSDTINDNEATPSKELYIQGKT